jgi:YHS domain-containing protein
MAGIIVITGTGRHGGARVAGHRGEGDMRKLLTLLVGIALTGATAYAKDLVNVDPAGLALQGYDPVAFFSDGKAVSGKADLTALYQGATYRFATEQHQATFNQDPARYAPAFGGFCAYAVSQGHTAPVEIDTWQILDGRLLLNYNLKVKGMFDADRQANVKKADSNWPNLVEKQGR